jgi:hypothetical protein
MAEWTVEKSNQGPVYLGYRLGAHQGTIHACFRALVYNKGGLVLHMLRRLMGDDAFFKGVARFYTTWRFKKGRHRRSEGGVRGGVASIAGSLLHPLDLQRHAAAAQVQLQNRRHRRRRPVRTGGRRLRRAGDRQAELREPDTGGVGGHSITEQLTEQRIPLKGVLKDVDANSDNAAPVLFVK